MAARLCALLLEFALASAARRGSGGFGRKNSAIPFLIPVSSEGVFHG